MGGDYDDFKMATTPLEEKSHNFLNGDVLIGIFEKLYNGQKVDVTLKGRTFSVGKTNRSRRFHKGDRNRYQIVRVICRSICG